jgi:hypothetical protein
MLFTFFWRNLGLRGISKYVVNDGASTRVDYENEEEEEEEEMLEEDPGGIVQLSRDLFLFSCGVIGDHCGQGVFTHHLFSGEEFSN